MTNKENQLDKSLHESGNIRLTVGSAGRCRMTGDEIKPDTPRVCISTNLLLDEDAKRWARISIGAVDALVDDLQQSMSNGSDCWIGEDLFLITSSTDQEDGSSKEPDLEAVECPVCGDAVYTSGNYLGISEIGYSPSPLLHTNCVSDLCRALQRVWDFSDQLLSHQV